MLKFLKKIFSTKDKDAALRRFKWKGIQEVSRIDKEMELHESMILVGHHQSNIYLHENVHLWVKGQLDGAIIGHSANIVKITGKVNGVIAAYYLECWKGCEIKGGIAVSKLLIQKGVKLDGGNISIDEVERLRNRKK